MRRSMIALLPAAAVALLTASCGLDPSDTRVPPSVATVPVPTTATTSAPMTTMSPATTSPVAPTTTAAPTTTPLPPTTVPTDDRFGVPLDAADPATAAFSGVVAVHGIGSACTGFLLANSVPTAPAYVITNGHCVGIFDSTSVFADADVAGGTVTFRQLAGAADGAREVTVDRVRYGTMRGTDVGVLELAATNAELAADGIASYTPAPFAPQGSPVHVVGIPVNGPEEQVLRRTDCTAGGTSRLVEFQWIWDVVQSNDCQGIVGGHSGSPLFDDSGAVVGLVNTTTYEATPGVSCHLGQPCEVTPAGVTSSENTSYVMPVDGLVNCFGADGRFRLGDPCPLEDPTTAVSLREFQQYTQQATAWDTVRLTTKVDPIMSNENATDALAVAVKAGPLATTDCRDPEGYVIADDSLTFTAPVDDAVEAILIACMAPVDADGTPQVREAGYSLMRIDRTAPMGDIELATLGSAAAGYSFEPIFVVPELINYQVKYGAPATTDCDDRADYFPYRRVTFRVEPSEVPLSVCVIGADYAGNESPPKRFELS